MRRLRVLVCGTNYGRAYLAALARSPHKYELVGILAQGSARSRDLATAKGVPLYGSAEELPDNIDLACAAMSSAAWPVVLLLIRHGVHILCEHPQRPETLKKAIAAARKRNLQFHLNGHFGNLPSARAFARACERAGKLTRPEFIEVLATERSLYATLDILRMALGKLRPLRVRRLAQRTPFVLLEGSLGKVPIQFKVQVSGERGTGQLADGSPDYVLDQRVTVGFPSGLLTLLSIGGPVVWNANSAHAIENGTSLWSILCEQETKTVDDLREQRIQANLDALNSIRQSILGHGTPQAQQPQHILEVSGAWESISRQLYSA